MSIQFVVAAATVASTVASAASAAQASKQGQIAANVEAAQHTENARLARVKALQSEVQRRKDLELVTAQNEAEAAQRGGSAFASDSFAAIQRYNQRTVNDDIGNIRLFGMADAARSARAAQASQYEVGALKRSGRLSLAGSVFKLGTNASTYRNVFAKGNTTEVG